MNVLILLFFSSCSAIFLTRSLSVSISNVLASRIETVHSDGASRMRKSVPSDSLSSRSDRSDTIISTVLLFILKFSREFLREKSSSFLSHIFCFVIGSLLPCATFPYSDISSSLGALILIRLAPSLSVFSAVSACSSLSGIGRIPLPLVRAISTAHIKLPGVFIWSLPCFSDLSKSTFSFVISVHSTSRSSSAPAAIRFSIADTSSVAQSAKVSSSRWQPQKAWPSMNIMIGLRPTASRQDAYSTARSRQVPCFCSSTVFARRIFCPIYSKLAGGILYAILLAHSAAYKAAICCFTKFGFCRWYALKAVVSAHFLRYTDASEMTFAISGWFGVTNAAISSGSNARPLHSLNARSWTGTSFW